MFRRNTSSLQSSMFLAIDDPDEDQDEDLIGLDAIIPGGKYSNDNYSYSCVQ